MAQRQWRTDLRQRDEEGLTLEPSGFVTFLRCVILLGPRSRNASRRALRDFDLYQNDFTSPITRNHSFFKDKNFQQDNWSCLSLPCHQANSHDISVLVPESTAKNHVVCKTVSFEKIHSFIICIHRNSVIRANDCWVFESL